MDRYEDKQRFCSIISLSYLKFFLTQIESFNATCKGDFVFFVLCVDRESYRFLCKIELDSVVPIYWEDIADRELKKQKVKHENELAKFCWVSKTFFLKYLLNKKNLESVIYLDADILCLKKPQGLFEKDLKSSPVLLTPHYYSQKLKRKGYHEKNGMFNAGFVGVNKKGIRFLNWWQKKCYEKCGKFPGIKPVDGGMDDQGYLDGVPQKFPKTKVLGKEYNLGPWNMRDIRRMNGRYYVSTREIVFCHFHNLKIENWRIQQKCLGNVDYELEEAEPLYKIFSHYLSIVASKYSNQDEKDYQVLIKNESPDILFQVFSEHLNQFQGKQFDWPEKIHFLYLVAAVHEKNLNLSRAIELYGWISKCQILASDAVKGAAAFHLGELLLKKQKQEDAREAFHHCLDRLPEHALAKKYLTKLGVKK